MLKMLTTGLRNAVGQARCRVFDWQHGVDTCGSSKLADLTIVGSNTSHGGPYYASHPKFLFELISSLDIDYPAYTFVDIGSGKGRVLLIASEFPFLEVIGVEFAIELHEIASRNIRSYRSRTQKCKNVKSLNADAMEFDMPLTPLVLYFFNPFRPPVWIPVLQRLQRSLDAHPRDVILLYENPCHAALIEEHTALKFVGESPYHKAYRFNPALTTS